MDISRSAPGRGVFLGSSFVQFTIGYFLVESLVCRLNSGGAVQLMALGLEWKRSQSYFKGKKKMNQYEIRHVK